ncbi:MGH1-like glycoside hydrolase domain-containing protein [Salibacterium aidingense]|uniref:MGH1-like glycoside hydrolase domain-containing protein n=1 Tax=Salibacterium aidingense TaxID=384933 RepID=UPI003BE71B63
MFDTIRKRLKKPLPLQENNPLHREFLESGVHFVCNNRELERTFERAVEELFECITFDFNGTPVLLEGGVYPGCWLESTGTISAEVLSRFMPSVSKATFEMFADNQLEDGLLPYKVTADGPAYRQIQMVTPLARSVWNHYLLHPDESFLHKMYQAVERFDRWLVQYRDTRKTGCVEAFCTFDTGHDLSPRFWHIPDTPYLQDPRRCHPHSPVLPFLAPDLTANVFCQRTYSDVMAEELNLSNQWKEAAEASFHSLMTYCFDEEDHFFYDIDRNGKKVKIQSDILLRVMACEVEDSAFFQEALQRYLLNTRKFYANYPLTSIAMDDPRFDPFSHYNSWAGPTNFLSVLRTPHAFEYHQHHVELTWISQQILDAFTRMTHFSQCISPWTGEAGFTSGYSPAIISTLDIIERYCGIMVRPDSKVWFTGLVPPCVEKGAEGSRSTAYRRKIEGDEYELVNTPQESRVYKNDRLLYQFPNGIRVAADREGRLQSITGMSIQTITGSLFYQEDPYSFTIHGNQELTFSAAGFTTRSDVGVVTPSY